jgi:hypothetical protein
MRAALPTEESSNSGAERAGTVVLCARRKRKCHAANGRKRQSWIPWFSNCEAVTNG